VIANLIKSATFLKNFLKLLVVALSIWFIYHRIFISQDFTLFSKELLKAFENKFNLLLMVLVMLLFALNWITESYKWKLLLSKFYYLSLFNSLKAVFAGVTVGLFTPNRIGEYGGRIIFIAPKERINAIMATIAGNIAQLAITLVFGTSGVIIMILNHSEFQISFIWIFCLLLIVLGTLWLYFNVQRIPDLIPVKFEKYFEALKNYNSRELFNVLLLSTIRYGFFFMQYLMLLWVFGVKINLIEAFYLIPTVYLIISIIPTFALVEWGVRGATALAIIGLVSDNDSGVLAASTSLWIINIALPAIIGSFNIAKSEF
jgi:hypothetical protein